MVSWRTGQTDQYLYERGKVKMALCRFKQKESKVIQRAIEDVESFQKHFNVVDKHKDAPEKARTVSRCSM